MADPTQVECTSFKLGLSRCCLTALKQNHVKFDFLQSCETTKSSSKQISTSVLRLYDRLYEMFRTFVLEIYKCVILTWMYINVVVTQFRLPNPLLQVMANAYLHFCSHSRGSGRAGRKCQDTLCSIFWALLNSQRACESSIHQPVPTASLREPPPSIVEGHASYRTHKERNWYPWNLSTL